MHNAHREVTQAPLMTRVPVSNPTCLCPQVALFDRIHSIRVKAIQEEYQRYMERVRTKAQNAIDQANTQYQHSRTMLTARVDALVHYLQQRHLQVCCPVTHSSYNCTLE